MRQDIAQARSNQRTLRQKRVDQRLGVFGEFIIVRRLFRENPCLGDLVVILVVRQLPRDECIQNDAQTPNIHFLAGIFLALEHFGGAVADGATECLQIARLAFVFPRKPKIAQLDVFLLVEQDVLQLEVSMNTGLAMDVGDGANELCEDPLDLFNGQRAMTEEIVVEFITRAIFEHQPNQLFCYDNLIESGDVRMEELAMVVNFTGQIGVFSRRRLENDLQTRITSSEILFFQPCQNAFVC